jgi:hypothetical protein
MASTQIYITIEAKSKLDKLAELEHRTLDGQLHYLCDLRLKELNIPDVNAPTDGILPQATIQSQGN